MLCLLLFSVRAVLGLRAFGVLGFERDGMLEGMLGPFETFVSVATS